MCYNIMTYNTETCTIHFTKTQDKTRQPRQPNPSNIFMQHYHSENQAKFSVATDQPANCLVLRPNNIII